ncbi:MAG: SynChlorMet cassette protein ScmD [Chlorobiaceae bacterium]|jgi:SynChlorMet cassette protein ScmD
MKYDNKPLADPLLVLREEFDDWAILFDPDTGDSFGLNPVSVFIFKHLDGRHTLQSIMTELLDKCEDAPDDAEQYVREFIDDLVERGFAGYALGAEVNAL